MGFSEPILPRKIGDHKMLNYDYCAWKNNSRRSLRFLTYQTNLTFPLLCDINVRTGIKYSYNKQLRASAFL